MPQLYELNGLIYPDVQTEQYPEAVPVTPEQAAQIEAGTHVVINRQVVPRPVHVPTLEELRAEAQHQIQINAAEALADGVAVELDGAVYTLAATDRDQELFNRDASRIAADKLGDEDFDPDEVVAFRDVSGSFHQLPVLQYAKLLGRYARTIRGIWQQVAQKSIQVSECDTAEELAELDLSISEGAP